MMTEWSFMCERSLGHWCPLVLEDNKVFRCLKGWSSANAPQIQIWYAFVLIRFIMRLLYSLSRSAVMSGPLRSNLHSSPWASRAGCERWGRLHLQGPLALRLKRHWHATYEPLGSWDVAHLLITPVHMQRTRLEEKKCWVQNTRLGGGRWSMMVYFCKFTLSKTAGFFHRLLDDCRK